MKKFAGSKNFTRLICAIGGLIVLLGVFQAGIFVGFHKAAFSYHMGENYYRAFGGSGRGNDWMPNDREFPNAHGAIGQIIKLSFPTMTVLGVDRIEKVVVLDGSTEIRRGRSAMSLHELKLNDMVVIIGSPNNDGEITARLIRVIPPPPGWNSDAVGPTENASTSVITK